MEHSTKHNVRNKYEQAWLYRIYGCVSVAVLLLGCCLFAGINFLYITSNIKTDVEESATTAVEYNEIHTIIDNPSEYVGKAIVVCGYLCKEMGKDTGLAWLSEKPERSKDEVGTYLIRLENSDPFDYTAEAIAVQGTLHNIQEDDGTYSLVLTESKFYKYDGQNKEMLLHNEVVRADVINAVAIALLYENTETDVCDILDEIQQIANKYSHVELENTICSIDELSHKKQSLSQEEFENQAEQLWDQFINILLDK